MIELLQITNDPALARRCEALGGMRIFLDLERNGKAERQAGRNTFISAHDVDDIAPVKAVLRNTRLMVRVNPLHAQSKQEVDAVIEAGADLLMLPMFTTAHEVREFASIVAGRRPISALLETPGALDSIDEWVGTPGLEEVFVGLNDLHIALGCRFMFEPLARGIVDQVARKVRNARLRFGFGGIARMDEGTLPGRDVLAEHLRLGSGGVILSRTFMQGLESDAVAQQIAALRSAEARLALRGPAQVESDRERIRQAILRLGAAATANP